MKEKAAESSFERGDLNDLNDLSQCVNDLKRKLLMMLHLIGPWKAIVKPHVLDVHKSTHDTTPHHQHQQVEDKSMRR